MEKFNRREFHFDKFKANRRKVVELSQEDLVNMECLDSRKEFPLVVEPQAEGFNLVAWAEGNRELIEHKLLEWGAMLFRGFKVDGISQSKQFACAIPGELSDYRERAAPRREVASRVYTSTEFPADQSIPLHHEMSYSHNWPISLGKEVTEWL